MINARIANKFGFAINSYSSPRYIFASYIEIDSLIAIINNSNETTAAAVARLRKNSEQFSF